MKYKTIVIDPAWDLKLLSKSATKSMQGGDATKLSYHTMKDKELLDFPVADFADTNCNLFMWCVNSKLEFAFRLLHEWNFKYSTMLVWTKSNGLTMLGINYKTEYCLFAYQGKRELANSKNPIPTHFSFPRGKHSEKPKEFYDMILKKSPAPRIDIFARKRHYGFDAWGDQVESEPTTLEAYHG